ncbi:MAG: YciI family protein [Burkholderiales bacterium]
MKYLCLICAETWMERFAPAEAAAHFEEYREFTENLRAGGQFLAANRLQPPETAVTVRVRQGRVTATDGPYAETKEQLGGYYMVEARDLNEAIQIAARIPGARYGCVEIRPVADDVQTRNALGVPK